ncbi:MAG TPA: periplasmic heavy metal sensor [Algoriphagus sp.]|nr:periplasmic heavy metal sensor [Algoriphagus sp.]
MKKTLAILLVFLGGVTHAQDMFQEYLYSADLVMKNRDKISLSDAQAEKIKKIHSVNASDFSTLKWDLDAATEKLKALLAQPKPNADAVSKQMDVVLALENQLKKKQLTTLVAIKNELTESQQATLKTSRTYTTLSDISPTLATGTKYRIGRPIGTTSSVSGPGVAALSDDTKSRVYIQMDQNNPDAAPLYILKTKKGGYEEFTDFEKIDPNNIESLEVLKGETAMVQFGEKGKNGVIIFTLKQSPENLPQEF